MGILSWIIFGLIAGILAKWIMPGKDGGGFFMTILLGIVGAVVGGWISTLFGFGKVDGFNFGSFVVAVIGAIVGSDSNLLIVFYVQIMPDDLVMQLHRF
ncbi:GlsB/YeaQ/YmgE family stress response membrane protein [Escherichia coli]|nr:GlsB/YeaQ/YmgE family stress response membrane protein [Escherichia coli]PAS88260.1 GlsB/YeaQ/YmgE family stress response membrane protein [Escherichia coli]